MFVSVDHRLCTLFPNAFSGRLDVPFYNAHLLIPPSSALLCIVASADIPRSRNLLLDNVTRYLEQYGSCQHYTDPGCGMGAFGW